MSLLFENDINSEALSSYWDASSTATREDFPTSSGNYYAVSGSLALDISQFHAPLSNDTYTIVIKSGPHGFGVTGTGIGDDHSGSFEFTLYVDSGMGNTVVFSIYDGKFTITSGSDDTSSSPTILVGSYDHRTPGSILTILVSSNGDGTATVVGNFYQGGVVDGTPDGTGTKSDVAANYIWVTTPLSFWNGYVTDNFTLSYFALYLGDYSCLEEGSLIETIDGIKPVEYLTPSDILVGDDGRPNPITNIWKTYIPAELSVVTIGSVSLSDKHLVRLGEAWLPSRSHGESSMRKNFFYQIETEKYGFQSGGISFASWTGDYIRSNFEHLLMRKLF